MMKKLLAAVFCICLVWATSGCENNITINANDDDDAADNGGNNNNNNGGQVVPVPSVPSVAGTWQITDLSYGKNATAVMTQDGQVLGGTIDNIKGRHGTISGTITSAGHIQMRFTFPAGTTDVTVDVSGNTMTGTWTDNRDGAVAQISGVKS